MSDDIVKIKIKQTSNNNTYDIEILKSATVMELKAACLEKSGVEPNCRI